MSIKKPEVYRGVVALYGRQIDGKRMTFARVGAAMNLSPERVRQIWLKSLRLERRKCRECRPEPLEMDMAGMTITMRFVKDEQKEL